MHKYAIAIELTQEELKDAGWLVTVGSSMFNIVTEYYPAFTDALGQSEARPKKSVAGLIVESADWTQAMTDLIAVGRARHNSENSANLIPDDQQLIWNAGYSFSQYKDPITDLYERTGDFVIVPSEVYNLNIETLVRALGMSDTEDDVIAKHFIWLDENGDDYYPSLEEFNERKGLTKSGWQKLKGITAKFVDDDGDEYYVIEIKALNDYLREREALYLIGQSSLAPNFTICRTAEMVLDWVTLK